MKKGDTLWGISRTYGVDVEELLRFNPNLEAERMPEV